MLIIFPVIKLPISTQKKLNVLRKLCEYPLKIRAGMLPSCPYVQHVVEV